MNLGQDSCKTLHSAAPSMNKQSDQAEFAVAVRQCYTQLTDWHQTYTTATEDDDVGPGNQGIDTLLADGELGKSKGNKFWIRERKRSRGAKTGRDASALLPLSLLCNHMPFSPPKKHAFEPPQKNSAHTVSLVRRLGIGILFCTNILLLGVQAFPGLDRYLKVSMLWTFFCWIIFLYFVPWQIHKKIESDIHFGSSTWCFGSQN
jgi:hypothetical protein